LGLKRGIVFTFFLGLIFSLVQGTIFANHSYSPKRHITSTHSNTQHEYFCADASDPNIPLTTVDAYSTLKTELYSRNYDGLANNKIYWLQGGGGSTACKNLSSSDLALNTFRYYIEDKYNSDIINKCDSGNTYSRYSCVTRSGATVQSDGHYHYSYGEINIRYQDWVNVQHYIINHETGHILGLKDGSGSTDCPGSIMHSSDYGCSNGHPSDPYQIDLNSITTEANSN
jgi:hypothetical protein